MRGEPDVGIDQADLPRQVVFFLAIPYRIGLPDGFVVSYLLEESFPQLRGFAWHQTRESPPFPDDWAGRMFVSLRFWQAPAEPETLQQWRSYLELFHRVLPSELRRYWKKPGRRTLRRMGRSPPFSKLLSIVEAVTLLPGTGKEEDELTNAFDRCLEHLHLAARAYRLATKSQFPPPSYDQLPLFVPFITREIESQGEWDEEGFRLFHLRHVTADTLTPELIQTPEQLELYDLSVFSIDSGHPGVRVSEAALDARWALLAGDYSAAVSRSHTAIEILLDTVISLMLWEEGMLPQVAADRVFTQSLQRRVRSQFGPRLGGDWNTRGDGPIGGWGQRLAVLRGRVVHSGYTPSRREAREAIDIAATVEGYTMNRLVANRTSYMRTTLLMLGRPGLVKRGLLTGQIARFEAKADTEPDWVPMYQLWRSELDKRRF